MALEYNEFTNHYLRHVFRHIVVKVVLIGQLGHGPEIVEH